MNNNEIYDQYDKYIFVQGNLKEIFSWYEANKNIMLLHENTRKQVEELLNKIEERLEEVRNE